MARLDDLLNADGVAAVGELAADGALVDFKSKMGMSPELAAMTAQFCATVTMLFNTLAGAYTHYGRGVLTTVGFTTNRRNQPWQTMPPLKCW
jgi:roadblock/LC7 domain-containing protein